MLAVREFAVECLGVRERWHARRSGSPLFAFATAYAATMIPFVVSMMALGVTAHWAAWLAAGLVAGFTQNALVLLMHEGSHGFFHTRRTTNDTLANWLVCAPIFNSVDDYRRTHIVHHRDCCDHKDPYFGLYGPYGTKRSVVLGFVQDISGVTAVRTFLRRYEATDRPPASAAGVAVGRILVVQTALAGIFWAVTGAWWAYGLLWALPLLTVPTTINRMRTFVEHHAAAGDVEANRSTLPTWWEYFLIAPYGYAFHFEHHLMPEIPYHQLKWAHAELAEAGVDFRDEHLARRGYLRAFARLFRALA